MDVFEDERAVKSVQCNVDPFDDRNKKGYRFLAGRIKPLLYELSPFDLTLYVDADTYFQASPNEGFRLLDKWDIALAETQTRALAQGIAGQDECNATADEFGTGLLLYHNSGMIFWKKNERVAALFKLWSEEWRRFGGWDEQVALLRALLRSEALYLTLPYTWNNSDPKECYMLSHWFGAGDARVDGVQRVRNLQPAMQKVKQNPLIKIEIRPGQYVRCRPEHEVEVRKNYGLQINQSMIEERDKMRNDNPLVKVPQGRPGEFVKMRLKDVIRLGLPYEHEKRIVPEGNKMIKPHGNKEAPTVQDDEAKSEASFSQTLDEADFTEIPGVGKTTNEALHEHGVHTFEALKGADISFLKGRAVRTIEKWQADYS